MSEIDKTLREIAEAVAEMKASHAADIAEIKKQGQSDPLMVEKIDRIAESLNELDAKKVDAEKQAKMERRIAELEDDVSRARAGKSSSMTPEQKAHFDAFAAFVRDPRDAAARNALSEASKTVSGTSGATGGFAVPEVISRTIYEKLQDISPLRQIVDVTTVGTSDYKELVDVNGESYEWVGESGTRSQQTEPQLAEVAPTMGTVNAYYWANEEAVDDMFINVQNWLSTAAARAFARAEGLAFVSGNGTNKPTGFLNSSPVSTGDEDSPARAFGTVQYIPTGVAYSSSDPFGVLATTSPTFFPDTAFINIKTTLKTGYHAGAVWLMNRGTMGDVMKIRDNEGRSLWQQSFAAMTPSTIYGYPVVEFPDMPDTGTNAHPIAFGNFRDGYVYVERHGLRVTIDEVTKPGAIKWNIRRRVGGKVRNDDAIKVIKNAAS